MDVNDQFLTERLVLFCELLCISTSKLFVRSHKLEYVGLRVAFMQFLPNGFNKSRVARLFGYHPTSVTHWLALHEQYILCQEYQQILTLIK